MGLKNTHFDVLENAEFTLAKRVALPLCRAKSRMSPFPRN